MLTHPNIIQFKEIIRDTKYDYCHIVMEYANDGDLSQKIKLQKTKPFSEEKILSYFIQICYAVKYIHDKKIIHRDIKAANVFLMKDGQVKLGDFGIARRLSPLKNKATTITGTPYYLSPEIINNEPYDYKSDIWALGVLLYELCTLKLPFESNNIAQLSMKIIRGTYRPIPCFFSKELRKLLNDLLNVNPKQRPTINQILNYNIIKEKMRTKRGFSEILRNKFSSKIMHCNSSRNSKAKNEEVHKFGSKPVNIFSSVSIESSKNPSGSDKNPHNKILEEFMKNKQEKIKKSYIISQSINNCWNGRSYSIFNGNSDDYFSNFDSSNEKPNVLNRVNSEIKGIGGNRRRIDEVEVLKSFEFEETKEMNKIDIDKSISFEIEENEEEDKSSQDSLPVPEEDEGNVIKLDLDYVPNKFETHQKDKEDDFFLFTQTEKEIQPEEKKEEVPEVSIKDDISKKIGEDILNELTNLVKDKLGPDVTNYNYQKLCSLIKEKYSSYYDSTLVNDAINYLPEILYLTILSPK